MQGEPNPVQPDVLKEKKAKSDQSQPGARYPDGKPLKPRGTKRCMRSFHKGNDRDSREGVRLMGQGLEKLWVALSKRA
jgi:hypothetical protein